MAIFTTKINLNDNKYFQLTGDTLSLSGTTYLGQAQYLDNNNVVFNDNTLINKNYLDFRLFTFSGSSNTLVSGATNGLTLSDKNVELGGTLNKNTSIIGNFILDLGNNTLILSGNTYVKNLEYLTNNNSNFNKLSVTDVNYVTGKTNSLLNKINYISGVTNTKLNTTLFNTYTGTTIPNNYYNKSQINQYTGETQTNLFLKLDKTIFNAYTGNTNNKINHISGVTNTKLNTSLFNTYTGNTQTILNNKMNIVTGATLNNVAVFNSSGSVIDSGINKALIYAGLVM